DIGISAFSGCKKLAALTLPPALQVLRESAFSKCASLAEMAIPGGLSEIKPNTFAGCTGLRRVVIPPNVKKISRYAFAGCTNLEWVECEEPERFEAALLDTPCWRKAHSDTPRGERLPLDLVGNRSGRRLIERGY